MQKTVPKIISEIYGTTGGTVGKGGCRAESKYTGSRLWPSLVKAKMHQGGVSVFLDTLFERATHDRDFCIIKVATNMELVFL